MSFDDSESIFQPDDSEEENGKLIEEVDDDSFTDPENNPIVPEEKSPDVNEPKEPTWKKNGHEDAILRAVCAVGKFYSK